MFPPEVQMDHKKLFRIYRDERLTVRKRGGRKRALGTRSSMLLAQLKNQRWSLDFVADALGDGRRFRIPALTVRQPGSKAETGRYGIVLGGATSSGILTLRFVHLFSTRKTP